MGQTHISESFKLAFDFKSGGIISILRIVEVFVHNTYLFGKYFAVERVQIS